MGKNGSGNASEAGSGSTASTHDMGDKGVLELDPTRRYMRFNDPLGKGAYKKVWKAFDQIDGIEVAWNRVSIDRLLQSPENLSRLYSEVHFLKTLKHENILKYYNSWVDDEKRTINIITELFTSGSLREYRKKHDSVNLKAIKNWARQILRGLEYLHGHEPPIIHRDLKCDNIFVNGNNGEVKIGDLGLATMMIQDKAQSVLGTPEFMAPELYEEEYNELVDIYSFGMCMLEMVTLDYPYSECRNAAQIYKRVTSGVKPEALQRVTDMEVREFIEKCLVHVSKRKSAKELLKDPFLRCNSSFEMKRKIPLPFALSKSQSDASSKDMLMDIEAECQSDSICENVEEYNVEMQLPSLDLVRTNEDNEFWLRGVLHDENMVEFFMNIYSPNIPRKTVHFVFYLDSDTSLMVAEEMVEQLELPDYYVSFISEFIDYLIMCLVPDWTPLDEEFSSVDYASTVGNGSCNLDNEFSMKNEFVEANSGRIESNLSPEKKSDVPRNRLSPNSTLVNDDDTSLNKFCEEEQSIFGLALAQLLGTSEDRKPNSSDSLTSTDLLETSEDTKAESNSSLTLSQLSGDNINAKANTDSLLASMQLVKIDMASTIIECNCEKGETSTTSNGCNAIEAIEKKFLNGCTIQSTCKDGKDGLQTEIDDIKKHYRHLFQEMTRMREMALENARKRWMRKMGKRPA